MKVRSIINNSIDVLMIKFISFENETLMEDIIKIYPRSIVIFHDSRNMWVRYQPKDCNVKNRIYTFTSGNNDIDYLLKPFVFLFLYINQFIFVLKIIIKYRVKKIFTANVFLAIFTGILRKLNFIERSIYFCPDWLEGSTTKFGIWTKLGNNLIFPYSDYLASKLNDVTLDLTKEMRDSRIKYWGKTITNKELIFQSRLKILSNENNNKIGNNILFLGMTRKDSGLEHVIKALSLLKIKNNFNLKIIGPENSFHNYLKKLAKENIVEDRLIFTGFIERKNFLSNISDCFCGVNIITNKDSFSSKTLPAKIIDYLEYLKPVIVTDNVGAIAGTIKEQELGIIIKPNAKEFINAVNKIHKENIQFKKNIIRYINNVKSTDVREIFEE